METLFSGSNRLRNQMRTWLRVAAILICIAPCAIFAATFTSALDNNPIILGESTALSLTIEGGSVSQEPAVPAIDGLRIVYIGPSQQVSFINGQVNSKTTYNYSVTPQRAGQFEIPAITVTVGIQKLSSQPLKLSVTKPGAPSAEAINSGQQSAFMKLLPPKKEVFAGEIFTTEMDIYIRDGARVGGFQLTSFPVNGLTLGKNVEGQHRREQIGNAVYEVIPISFAVTAAKPGEATIGPATATIIEEVPVKNARSRDPFGDMPDPFGMLRRVERHQLNLATETATVKSLPLPTENAPAGFAGAVGKFTMSVTAGPTNVTVGDPITLRVQISGRGALDLISLPEQAQSAWQNFKTYPPTAKVETTDALGLEGSKTFEEIVVPQSADVRELPPISFSFFEPDAKEYRALTQPALQLAVRSGGTSVAPTMLVSKSPTDNTPPPAQDIVPIKQRLGAVQPISAPLTQQRWFLAAQGVPVLAWMATLVWRKRKDHLANNPRLRRQREVARVIQDGLKDLQRLAGENKPEEFFATLFRLLQERLGERLDLPASAITEAVIDERLRPGGVPEATLEKLQELFQLCNLARYAPVRGSQELAAVIPKLETVLDELEGVNA